MCVLYRLGVRKGVGGAVVPGTEEWLKFVQMEALKMQSNPIPLSAPFSFINPQDLANWQAQLAAMNMNGMEAAALQMQQLAALQMQQQAVAAAVQQQQQQQQHTEAAAVMATAPQFQLMPFVHPMNIAPISAHAAAIHDPNTLGESTTQHPFLPPLS